MSWSASCCVPSSPVARFVMLAPPDAFAAASCSSFAISATTVTWSAVTPGAGRAPVVGARLPRVGAGQADADVEEVDPGRRRSQLGFSTAPPWYRSPRRARACRPGSATRIRRSSPPRPGPVPVPAATSDTSRVVSSHLGLPRCGSRCWWTWGQHSVTLCEQCTSKPRKDNPGARGTMTVIDVDSHFQGPLTWFDEAFPSPRRSGPPSRPRR